MRQLVATSIICFAILLPSIVPIITHADLAQDCSNLSLSLSATPVSGSAPLAVTFDASLEGAWAAPIEYDWYFGDGSSKIYPNSGNPTETHMYWNPWTEPYKSFVSVKDSRGCWKQAFVTVMVSPATQPATILAWQVAAGLVSILLIALVAYWLQLRVRGKSAKTCRSCGFRNPPYARSFCVKCGFNLEAD